MKLRCYVIVMTILLVAPLTVGCCVLGKNVEGQKIDASGLDKLAANKTTATEIGDIFGAPTQVVKLSNGNAYIYRRSVAKATAVWLLFVSMGRNDKQYEQIVFFVDNNDMLTHNAANIHRSRKASCAMAPARATRV